jgi:L-ascorbate metabolism protein UlaG (beta-lactamase superfamily)
MKLTWLDNNSWLIEIAQKRILLDPWLVDSLVFANQGWLFRGEKTTFYPIPEQIDLILLSQGLEDHAHPPTLQKLDRNIPVVASPNAAKVVQKLGYTQVTSLPPGDSFNLENCLEIKAFPGSPIGPQLIENSYLLQDLTTGNTLYYEPHGFHHPSLKKLAPIDVILTPLIDIKLWQLFAVIQGNEKALEVCQWLQPQVIIPTAGGRDTIFKGLLAKFLSFEGSVQKFRSLLAQNTLATRVIDPKQGEPFSVELEKRAISL